MRALHVPNEILDCVFENLDKASLRNVRAVCRRWEPSGTRLLFDRVYLSNHSVDIQVFEYITRRQGIAAHAKELVLDVSTFNPDLLHFNVFVGLTEQHPPGCLRDNPGHWGHTTDAAENNEWHYRTGKACGFDVAKHREAQLEEAFRFFEWYEPQVRRHVENFRANRAMQVLRNALSAGWTVERVVVTSLPAGPAHEDRSDDPYEQPCRSPNVRYWQDTMPNTGGLVPLEEVLPRVSWFTPESEVYGVIQMLSGRQDIDTVLNAGTSFSAWDADHHVAGQGAGCFHAHPIVSPYQGLLSILDTLHEMGQRISSLSVAPSRRFHPDCCRCGEGMSSAIFVSDGPQMMRLQETAKHLKVLRLVPEAVTGLQGTKFEYPGLRRMLQLGTRLEEVYLEFMHHQTLSRDHHLLQGLTFTRLKKLHIFDVRFTDCDFIAFVYNNSGCLRRLVVCYCLMLDEHDPLLDQKEHPSTGWWRPVLEELRDRGCLENIGLFIDCVHQRMDTLRMDGEPERDEGIARWKAWVDRTGRFPLGPVATLEQKPTVPYGYRERLRGVLRREQDRRARSRGW